MDNPVPSPLILEDIDREISETRKDLNAFWQARRILRERVQEQIDHPVEPRFLPTIVEWSGSAGSLGVLDLAVHALERTLGELQEMRKSAKRESPKLQLVRSDDHDLN